MAVAMVGLQNSVVHSKCCYYDLVNWAILIFVELLLTVGMFPSLVYLYFMPFILIFCDSLLMIQ